MVKNIGYIGLGKMGGNMVLRLLEKGWEVNAFDPSESARASAEKAGAAVFESVAGMVKNLAHPRLIWLMVPNKAVDSVLGELVPMLERGDTLIDGGNTFFKDSIKRAELLREKGIDFLDAGVSGGPRGAREGACMMVGGSEEVYKKYENLFNALCVPEGYGRMGENGAGHFVKMVHNGIEYGMMQAMAEGFEIMKSSRFNLSLKKVARVYNHASVIESRLVGWLVDGFEKYGEELQDVSGEVAATGEGAWTVETAKQLGVPAPIIEGALKFREQSHGNPSYTGKVLSTLRNMFGGHEARLKKEN